MKSRTSKSVRSTSYPDWPSNVQFDTKEEVMTKDAEGNITLVSGPIPTISVWSNNGVKYCVEFNEFYQPLRKGGDILVRFIGSIAKVETYCPVGEVNWHNVDKKLKAMLVEEVKERFVIPDGPEYEKQILKRANRSWRHFKHELKSHYYKPDDKTLDEMCNLQPPYGITSNQWIKLVKHWHSELGKKLSEAGKDARASLNQLHRCGSKSFANKQADYEDEHGEKMSLLTLWKKAHIGKDGSFLPDTLTEEFMDDAYAKFESLKQANPSKSDLELEDEAFEHTMYDGEIPKRPVGYGLGVRKGDIYGVHGVLKKQGCGRVRKTAVFMENDKEELSTLKKENRLLNTQIQENKEEVSVLKKENSLLKAKVQENNSLLKTLVGQFSQLVGKVRKGEASMHLLDCAQAVLEVTNQKVLENNEGAKDQERMASK
ncbi:uncharacterized protein LOC125493631 [Beta vulgaris subsp. vulgaris]|uniref:uncharacterized protein LOC125493631 n=1 Tax=Beta vulgaris subsp. vulgaris TaxID=3555 RepID=UPI0025490431|nr:uncharacterized protein LOC125493631 [Beta vulgaris subsp. vulgaris]